MRARDLLPLSIKARLVRIAANSARGKTIRRQGLSVQCTGDAVEGRLLLSRAYEPALTRFIRSFMLDGDEFIDVGCNFGWFCLVAASAGARRVHAIDPNESAIARTILNAQINGFSTIVTTYAVAAWDKSAELKLEVASPAETARGFLRPGSGVTAVRLDQLIEDIGERVSVIKIDVEGAEANVLLGATRFLEREHGPVVAIEIADAWTSLASSADPCGILAALGYEPVRGDLDGNNRLFLPPAGRYRSRALEVGLQVDPYAPVAQQDRAPDS